MGGKGWQYISPGIREMERMMKLQVLPFFKFLLYLYIWSPVYFCLLDRLYICSGCSLIHTLSVHVCTSVCRNAFLYALFSSMHMLTITGQHKKAKIYIEHIWQHTAWPYFSQPICLNMSNSSLHDEVHAPDGMHVPVPIQEHFGTDEWYPCNPVLSFVN